MIKRLTYIMSIVSMHKDYWRTVGTQAIDSIIRHL